MENNFGTEFAVRRSTNQLNETDMRLGIYVILEENVSEHNMGTIRKTSVYKAVTDSETARIELRARVEEKCAELGFEDVDLPSNMEEFDLYHAFKDEVEDDYFKMWIEYTEVE